jgi:flagellar M-ring protein FliF
LTSGAAGEQEMLAPHGGWEQGGELEEMAHMPVLPRKSKAQLEAQGIFEQVSEHIRREPAQSTRLLECWIGSTEEAQ